MSATQRKFHPKARYFARRFALQALYQWEITQTPVAMLEAQFLANADIQKADVSYFREILRGVIHQYEMLDKRMEPFLDRSLGSLNYIELAVLRIAVYELSERFDVPYRVIINEALELTKQFGTVEGYKFVNGVLDKVAKTLRVDDTP
jgi:N utilization substance protein B